MQMLIYLLAIVASLVVAFAVFGGLIGAASVVEKYFAKRKEDSDFGSMKYFWGTWSGKLELVDVSSPIEVHLPGDRNEPDSRSRDLLLRIAKQWKSVEQQFAQHFRIEISEGDVPAEIQELCEAAIRRDDNVELLSLSEVSDISVEKHEETGELRLWINFLHRWDPEHTRALLLNEQLEVLEYGLTCAL